jgi:hypothetical protein
MLLNLFSFFKNCLSGVVSVKCWTLQRKLPIMRRVTFTSIAAISGRMFCSSSAIGLCLALEVPPDYAAIKERIGGLEGHRIQAFPFRKSCTMV